MGKLALVALWACLAACGNNGGGGGGGDDDDQPPARCGDGIVDSNEQCDDGNSIANDGCTLCMIDTARVASIDVSWMLQTAAGDTAQCPSGFDTAAVTSQPVDAQGNNAGTAVIDLFDCSAAMGTTKPLPATTYSASVAITNQAMSQTFATSLSQAVDLSDATDKPLDVSFLTDGGKFHMAWQLVKMSDGTTPVDCATIGTTVTVRAALTNTTTMMTSNSSFQCAAGSGVTSAVIAGTYTVSTRLLKDFVTPEGDAADLTGQVIMAPDGLTDLGTVKIPVTGL
jgi:cysteine-rich repeat protein